MAQPQQRVSRDDLEAKFRALQGDVQAQVEDRKSMLMSALAIGGVLLLITLFLLGRKSGKSKTTLVEIRRV